MNLIKKLDVLHLKRHHTEVLPFPKTLQYVHPLYSPLNDSSHYHYSLFNFLLLILPYWYSHIVKFSLDPPTFLSESWEVQNFLLLFNSYFSLISIYLWFSSLVQFLFCWEVRKWFDFDFFYYSNLIYLNLNSIDFMVDYSDFVIFNFYEYYFLWM